MSAQRGLFKHKKPAPPASPNQERVGEAARRLRTLEARYSNLERRLQVTEQNMLANNRKLNLELKTANAEIQDLKTTLAELKERVVMLIGELRKTAQQTDVDVMKKYLSYWEPLRFVTEQQVERIVRQILDESNQKV